MEILVQILFPQVNKTILVEAFEHFKSDGVLTLPAPMPVGCTTLDTDEFKTQLLVAARSLSNLPLTSLEMGQVQVCCAFSSIIVNFLQGSTERLHPEIDI